MKNVSDNPITNLLMAIILLLTSIVAVEWLLPYQADARDDDKPGAAIDDGLTVSAQSRYVHPHISDFPEILTRPIFFSKRQMPVQQVIVAPVKSTPLLLKLEGIAIAADTRVAVLRDMGSNQLVQLSVGMSQDNWMLDGLTQSTATFRHGDDVTELTLDIDKN